MSKVPKPGFGLKSECGTENIFVCTCAFGAPLNPGSTTETNLPQSKLYVQFNFHSFTGVVSVTLRFHPQGRMLLRRESRKVGGRAATLVVSGFSCPNPGATRPHSNQLAQPPSYTYSHLRTTGPEWLQHRLYAHVQRRDALYSKLYDKLQGRQPATPHYRL